ncbi:MAG: hypothetical protein JWP97_4365 [Labilithrix sp.]|nr:hypothetical protein [Labilithrix sp.]
MAGASTRSITTVESILPSWCLASLGGQVPQRPIAHRRGMSYDDHAMKPKAVVLAWWLVAATIVSCGESDLDLPASGQGDGGSPVVEGGAGVPDAGVARDGGSTPGDAAEASTPCGDGILTPGETCDDGNTTSADGCNAGCKVEPGWSCSGTPSSCVTVCGDGIVAGGETCDDDATSCPDSCRGTLWSKRFGGSDYEHAFAVAVDATGAAIITGNFRGTANFGGGPLVSTGDDDVFVAKVDSTGKHLWSRRFGGIAGAEDRGRSVATDAAGNVVVAGNFSGTIDFGGGPLVSAGSWDIFVAKLDAAGNHLWSKRFGDADQQEAHTVAVDAAGDIVLGGTFWGSVDFGGGLLTSAGYVDAYVAKLDAAGNHVWSKRYGDADRQGTNGVAVDAAGNVFVTGDCAGTIDFGGGTLPPVGPMGKRDIFLFSLDPTGAHRWSKRFTSMGGIGIGVAADPSGNVILAAESSTTFMDLGTGPLPYKGEQDVILGKFSPAGDPIFARSFGSTGQDWVYAVAADPSGNILVTGTADTAMDFGNGPVSSASGPPSAFIAKLSPSGDLLSGTVHGTQATGTGIAADALGNVFASGIFRGPINFGGPSLTSELFGDDVYLVKFSP